jgi:hypothetical protein
MIEVVGQSNKNVQVHVRLMRAYLKINTLISITKLIYLII